MVRRVLSNGYYSPARKWKGKINYFGGVHNYEGKQLGKPSRKHKIHGTYLPAAAMFACSIAKEREREREREREGERELEWPMTS